MEDKEQEGIGEYIFVLETSLELYFTSSKTSFFCKDITIPLNKFMSILKEDS